MDRDITVQELKPCDILLYHGESTISQLIQWFDGSEYSHSSVYDGELVIEAIREGVLKNTVKVSMENTLYVDVYRLKKNGEFIGSSALPVAPVQKVIDHYAAEGGRFAYEEVLLLALLCTTRRLPLPFLRWALDSAAAVLADIVAGGRQPMVCSELVYRCSSEAGPKYRPSITGMDERSKIRGLQGVSGKGGTVTKSGEAIAEYLDKYAEAKHMKSKEMRKVTIAPDPNFVTPKDLKKSKDLVKIGRLVRPS